MSDNNRFKDVINAARNREQAAPAVPHTDRPQEPTSSGRLQGQSDQQAPPVAQQPAKRGRPPGGKRNNPDYEQVAAYIPKELYRQVQIRLLQMEPKGQFSDLVEFLLNKWIQQPPRQ